MFGGYGGIREGQGRYLSDCWKFELGGAEWVRLETSGDIPEGRSNYSLHYWGEQKEIVMFGGGS